MFRLQVLKGQGRQALGRSKGGFSTKIHLKTDLDDHSLAFDLTGGEIGTYRIFLFFWILVLMCSLVLLSATRNIRARQIDNMHDNAELFLSFRASPMRDTSPSILPENSIKQEPVSNRLSANYSASNGSHAGARRHNRITDRSSHLPLHSY